MTNYLHIDHLLMFTFFVNRSFLQIYRKQNKENEKQIKFLRGMYRDTPEIEYIYRLRVFIRQLCTSLSELIVNNTLSKWTEKRGVSLDWMNQVGSIKTYIIGYQ